MNREDYLPEWKVFNYMNEQLLNPYFLQMVEKWARYDRKEFWIGDMDVYVKNMGTFTTSFTSPAIIWGDDNKFVGFSLTETETTYTTYDVTKIRNIAVCSEYNTRILIAERFDEEIYYLTPKLYIYAVNDSGKHKASFPNFKHLKLDFESGMNQYEYYSMIQESAGDYKLNSFNDYTDRFRNYTSILGDLECLESDDEALEFSKHIVVPLRLTYEERLEKLESLKSKIFK